MHLSRRALLAAAAGSAGAAAVGTAPARAGGAGLPPAVRALEDQIQAGMARYRIPGVSYGLLYRGRQYVRGFGVTDVADPAPVTADTMFRVASTTKTFTGTAVLRLVERGRLDLDRTVRSYLPGFRTSDPAASARVTVRQLLQHTAGWLGDYFFDTGTQDGALAAYVEGMARLPQLTPPGRVFQYNNAALSVAGRLVEVVTGTSYEEAVKTLILEPLRLRHSEFFPGDVPGGVVATPHGPDGTGAPVPVPQALAMPRGVHPAGGLISSARDQLSWALYHLGDGRPLLRRSTLRAMQSRPGPGGTLFVELDGYGLSWMLRPTAEGPTVVQHGGDWPGHHSGFLMVPERGMALTVLTNSESGAELTAELFAGDSVLARLAGVHNLPAVPLSLPDAQLAGYTGSYSGSSVGPDGVLYTDSFDVVADAGQLSLRDDGQELLRLAFYRKDYVKVLLPDGTDTLFRADFVRGADGTVAWVRYSGRLYRRGGPATLAAPARHRPLFPPVI
ncbi:penicillin-binding protein [Actinoplanes sp. N902-109]|nr:penicillin-binding protein [Actinoplanes sp. N902-109]